MDRRTLAVLLALLAASGGVVAIGKVERDVSLHSVGEFWRDILQDADGVALTAATVSDAEEMELGRRLAGHTADSNSKYSWERNELARVGDKLVAHVRRKGIRYEFHVVDSRTVNAFALPGGRIYVTIAMFNFLKDDSERAAVLGHEIGHVDLKHCISRFQYELVAKRVNAAILGEIVDTARRLVNTAYSQNQELEADEFGQRIAIQAGYDAKAGAAVFERMQEQYGRHPRRPSDHPIGEVTGSIGDVLEGYFESHPPYEERVKRLKQMTAPVSK